MLVYATAARRDARFLTFFTALIVFVGMVWVGGGGDVSVLVKR